MNFSFHRIPVDNCICYLLRGESWKKIISMGAKRIYPAHRMDFPVDVMQKEISNIEVGQ